MSDLTLYGPHWSAYTRTARLVLSEKGLDYDLVEVDFSSGKMPEAQLARHPFAKVPVLDHLGFVLYETSAICRYVDTAFEGPLLQPKLPQEIGRMAQLVAVIDAYLSHEIRMGYVNEGLIKPMLGVEANLNTINTAHLSIAKGLAAMAKLVGERKFLTGETISLADLHAAPLFDYLDMAPGGSSLIDGQPKLRTWWDALSQRPSIQSTAINLSVFKIQN